MSSGTGATSRPRALVTGASSGLGAAFARRLAAEGHDLVLVARSRSALEELAAEIRGDHGCTAVVHVADLADPEQLAGVAQLVRGPAGGVEGPAGGVEGPAGGVEGPVDVLVNNAGFGFYGPVAGHAPEQELGMVDVDVRAVVALGHAAASAMVERGSGAILNVASVAAFASTPHSATYSAAKSFVLMYSEALHDELAPSGVKVTVLCPGFTRTNFQANAGIAAKGIPAFAWADADEVVAAGLAALARNQALCVPGALNKLTALSPRFTPRPLVRRIARQVMRRL